MEQLIKTLLTMTATASVAAVCVIILRLPLKRVPRWITCALWLVVFLRMVCPAGLSLPVSLVPQSVSGGSYVENILPAETQAASAKVSPAVSEGSVQPSTAATSATVHTAIPTETAPVWPAALAGVWAAGGAAALLWAVLSYIRLRRRIADAVLIEKNIYETDQIDTPFVCGLFRPRIYLPVALNGEDRRYVLLHEQAHIRRGDHLAKPLAYLALCVYWFNPILWLSYRLLCRDIETACDQAVIRSFGKEDTVQYAAALLHLGRKPSLPSAVPLAFGEEDAKGRVCSVLSYKKPAFWLVVAAVTACVAAGVLLLADRAAPPAQLEGQEIAQASVIEVLSWSGWWGDSPEIPTQVDLPEDLTRELVTLLDQTSHGNFVYYPTPREFPDRTVTLSSADGSATYYFLAENGDLVLYRVLSDPAGTPWRRATLDEALADSQAYQNWKASLESYLAFGRADDLYQLKAPYIGDPDDVTAILDAFCFEDVIGPYTVEFQIEERPYSILLHLENSPSTQEEQGWMECYLQNIGFLLLDLIENAEDVYFVYPEGTQVRVESGIYALSTISVEKGAKQGSLSREDFRFHFSFRYGDLTRYYPGKPSGRCYGVEKFLSLNPDLVELPQATEEETEALYESLHVVLRGDYFAVRLGNGRWEEGFSAFRDFDPHEDAPLPFVLTAPNGQTFDLSGAEDEISYVHAIINRETGQDTGYRLYQKEDTFYLAYFRLDSGQDTLAYLAQITRDPS